MKGPNINFLINIDFYNLDLWTFLGRGGGGGGGSERNVQRMFLVTKSICESSLGRLLFMGLNMCTKLQLIVK